MSITLYCTLFQSPENIVQPEFEEEVLLEEGKEDKEEDVAVDLGYDISEDEEEEEVGRRENKDLIYFFFFSNFYVILIGLIQLFNLQEEDSSDEDEDDEEREDKFAEEEDEFGQPRRGSEREYRQVYSTMIREH